MKICNVCLKSDILCSGCGKKLEQGLISKTDIELSRALFKLGLETDFLKSYDMEDSVFVLASRKHTGVLIGKSGKNAKRIGIMLGKDVRIIEHTDDEKMLIERIVGSQVLGINKVYGDKEFYKVKLERRMRNRVNPSAASKIIGKEVRFVFE